MVMTHQWISMMAHLEEVRSFSKGSVHNERRDPVQLSKNFRLHIIDVSTNQCTRVSDKNSSINFIDRPEHKRNDTISHSPFEKNG